MTLQCIVCTLRVPLHAADMANEGMYKLMD